MTEDLTQKRQAAYAALDAIPFMEKPWFFTSAYKEYQAKVETAERRLASLPTQIEMVHNTPDGGVVHNKWCHIFAIKRIHKSFVKSKKLDVAYSAARRRERTAKVAAYEADARRGSSSVRDSLLGAPTATFACPYCGKKIRAEESEADHIHPVTKGGLTVPTNMVMVCATCNGAKSGTHCVNFAKKQKKT